MFALLVGLTFPSLLVAAAFKDATSMTIPNAINLALVAAFFVVAPFTLSPAEIGAHLGVGACVLAAGFAMFALNWIGGGDAKLLAACALWLGLSSLLEFLLWTALAGGGLSLALIVARRAAFYAPVGFGQGALGRLLEPKGDIPYGLAISAAAIAAFPSSSIFVGALG